MVQALKRRTGWEKRKARVGKRIRAAAGGRLRLNVYRSNKHIYAQIVDDAQGKTVAAASTLTAGLKEAAAKSNKVDVAKQVGELIGKLAKEKGIESVVFDRSGYLYHGRIKALAEGAREAGLKF